MSMYIYANLPESYGSFNKIREDNYPFNRLFPKYLRVLIEIGNREKLDIFSLLGHIENELSGNDRLPDLPASNEKVNFRFSIEDADIETYYRDQELTNKMITQMIIRTTIRLTEVYGTSLSRLCAIIQGIDVTDDRVSETEADKKEIDDLKEKLRIKRSQGKKSRPTRSPVGDEPDVVDIKDNLLKKINEISRKAPIIEDNKPADTDKVTTADTKDKVVETNPYLKDFF